jgi:hypothetical protein
MLLRTSASRVAMKFHTLRSVSASVSGDLAASRRMPHMNSVLQIKSGDEFGQIVSTAVQVIPIPRLARSTVSASVVSDTAITARRQKVHLVLDSYTVFLDCVHAMCVARLMLNLRLRSNGTTPASAMPAKKLGDAS